MMHEFKAIRPGYAAIAAILALSSSPLLAQSAEPVTITPPAPVVAPAEAATTVAPAPAPAASTTAPRTTATGGGLDGLNVPAVTVDLGTADASPVDDVASVAAAPAAARPAVRSPSVAANPAPAPAPVASAPAEIADAAPAAPIASVDTAPAAQAPAEPAVAPVAATPVADAGGDLAPLAGAAGLGALLIAGGAVAYGRRRRAGEHDGELDRVEDGATTHLIDQPSAPTPVAAAPAYVAARTAAPASAAPVGFDTSRFSPRVQAAYAGPTADNPSQSLKARLKRARFFDQRERVGAPVPTETARATPAEAKSRYGEFAIGRSGGPKPGFRPAYQN